MFVRWSRAMFIGALVFSSSLPAAAQPSAWNVDVGSGGTVTVGDTKSRLSNGISTSARILGQRSVLASSMVPITFGIRFTGAPSRP